MGSESQDRASPALAGAPGQSLSAGSTAQPLPLPPGGTGLGCQGLASSPPPLGAAARWQVAPDLQKCWPGQGQCPRVWHFGSRAEERDPADRGSWFLQADPSWAFSRRVWLERSCWGRRALLFGQGGQPGKALMPAPVQFALGRHSGSCWLLGGGCSTPWCQF